MNQLFRFRNGTYEVRDDADSNPPFYRDFSASHVLCGTMIAKVTDVNTGKLNCKLKIAKGYDILQVKKAFRAHKDKDIQEVIEHRKTLHSLHSSSKLTLDPMLTYESPQKVCEVLAKIGEFAAEQDCLDYVPYAPCPHCCNRPLGTCDGEGCGCLYALDNSTANGTSLCREPPIQLRSVENAQYGKEQALTNETWLSPFPEESHAAAWVVHEEDKMLLNRARMLVRACDERARVRAARAHMRAASVEAPWPTYKDLCLAVQPAKRTMLCFINNAYAPQDALPAVLRGFWRGDCRADDILSGNQHAIVRANTAHQRYEVRRRARAANAKREAKGIIKRFIDGKRPAKLLPGVRL